MLSGAFRSFLAPLQFKCTLVRHPDLCLLGVVIIKRLRPFKDKGHTQNFEHNYILETNRDFHITMYVWRAIVYVLKEICNLYHLLNDIFSFQFSFLGGEINHSHTTHQLFDSRMLCFYVFIRNCIVNIGLNSPC